MGVYCLFFLFSDFFFFNDTATTEIYTRSIVGSVRCVQETGIGNECGSSYIDCHPSLIILIGAIVAVGFFILIFFICWMLKRQRRKEVETNPKLEAPEPNSSEKEKNFNSTSDALKLHMELGLFRTNSMSIEEAHVLCVDTCLLYTSPSPRDLSTSRMPSSA
eukprot:TRINITY_DN26066_c0_g1_i3.p2 TRINITY_DN26066_c0_g1~~TRINITY_DN26066_c0_g1_i3.p2  ORF type:complete len:162 (-),score=36.02 TRINITY_DN26066_c0_g1_i3:144-629(-)